MLLKIILSKPRSTDLSNELETHLKAITIVLMKRTPYFSLYTLSHYGKTSSGNVIKCHTQELNALIMLYFPVDKNQLTKMVSKSGILSEILNST